MDTKNITIKNSGIWAIVWTIIWLTMWISISGSAISHAIDRNTVEMKNLSEGQTYSTLVDRYTKSVEECNGDLVIKKSDFMKYAPHLASIEIVCKKK